MSTCMQAAQLLGRPNGPALILQAVHMAIQACRSDIECECAQVTDAHGHKWWDTDAGLFTGSHCDNDLEFVQMRQDCIQFLDQFQAFVRHPEHPAWIRFVLH